MDKQEILKILKKHDDNIFYGLVPEKKSMDLKTWDYLVVSKKIIKPSSTNNTRFSDYISITIVREDFIEEELIVKIIADMCKIPGIRLSDDEFKYDYITKGNTDLVCEILTIDFVKNIKRDICQV